MSLEAPAPAPQALRAGLWMLGAVASFSSMAVAGRAVSFELDTFEIMMYRSIVGFVLVLGVARLTGQIGTITTRSPRMHIIRNLCHFTGQNLWFYAITVIPLAQVFALEFTAPLWVLILSPPSSALPVSSSSPAPAPRPSTWARSRLRLRPSALPARS